MPLDARRKAGVSFVGYSSRSGSRGAGCGGFLAAVSAGCGLFNRRKPKRAAQGLKNRAQPMAKGGIIVRVAQSRD